MAPWIPRGARQSIVLTFPPGCRHHRVTGIFSTIPVPREGTGQLGALQPSDPDETPRARRSHPSSPGAPRWEGRMFPSQRSTCRAGSEIGKTPGAAHAGPGALPAGVVGCPRGQRAPTRPGRRQPPSSCSVGRSRRVRRGTGVGQALCRGSSRCHPRGRSGGERRVMPGLEQAAGISRGSEEQVRVISQRGGSPGHRAPGCPTTQAGVGEGKEHEAQRGLSSCRLMREGWTRGRTAARPGVP